MKKIFFAIFTVIFFVSCSSKGSQTQFNFGTACSVNLFESGSKKNYRKIFTRLNEIEKKFSVNIPASCVSKINDSAGINPVEVDDEFLYVLKKALEISEKSGGAFDVSIGKLVKLWGIGMNHGKIPSKKEIDSALRFINWKNIAITDSENEKSVCLAYKNSALDFGGIVKGYAADEIVKILQKNRIKRAVIDLGGNIYVYGTKKDKSEWFVGIKNPEDPDGNPVLGIKTDQTSVVTSGTYERFLEKDGQIYHHILDTKNGYPVENGISSVTVICKSSILADALSTALFALGVEQGFELIKKLDTNISAIYIERNGKITASKELEDKIQNFGKKSQITFE